MMLGDGDGDVTRRDGLESDTFGSVKVAIDDGGFQDAEQLPCNLFRLREEVVGSLTRDDAEMKQSQVGAMKMTCSSEHLFSLRLVPTLVELCLQRMTQDDDGDRQRASFPPGLLSLLREFRHQRWLQQVRFDWLIKALIQAERSVSDYLRPYIDQHGRRCVLFCRDTRHPEPLMGTRQTPDLVYVPGMLALPEPADGYDASDWGIAVLAHIINMLLPTAIAEPTSSCTPNDCDVTMAYARNVKCLLSKLAPELVYHCFSVALAYVLLSRGYINKVIQLILRHVAQKIPHGQNSCLGESDFHDVCLQKGLYLNELGRLVTCTDQPEMAGTFYRDAVMVTQDESPHNRLQLLVLCASAYDQGMMDQQHAERARSHWDIALSKPACPAEITQAALMSLLHCHTGRTSTNAQEHLLVEDENKHWLLEMESRLNEISLRDSSVCFHLSMVRALLGNKDNALQAYDNFRSYFRRTESTEVPGSVACSAPERRECCPWWVFSQWIPAKTPKVESSATFICMPLLWRRAFGYPGCIVANQVSTGRLTEVCGASLNLRITNDGLLTGTLMGNLPPITSFLLDPYTGRICVPSQNRHIELQKWDNFHEKQEANQPTLRSVLHYSTSQQEVTGAGGFDSLYSCGFRVDTFIPTPIHLLTDRHSGAVCSLLVSNNIVNYNRCKNQQEDWTFSERYPGISHHVAVLIFSNGFKDVKIDLRFVIMRARRDAVLEELRSNSEFIKNPSGIKEAQDILDSILTNNRQIPPSLAQEILEDRQGSFVSKLKRALRSENKELIEGCLPPPQTIRVSKILFVGESTVIMSMLCASHPYSSQGDNVLVFVDCESEETFKRPVVHFTKTSGSSWVLPEQTESWKKPGENKRVFFAYESVISGTSKNGKIVFDERGVILYREVSTIEEKSELQGYHTFVACSGWHILGYDETRTRVMSFDLRTRTFRRSVCLQLIDSLRVAGDVVFVSIPTGVLALDPVKLVPLVVHHASMSSINLMGLSKGDKGVVVEGEHRFLRILSSSDVRGGSVHAASYDGERCYTRVCLGLANRVIILHFTREISVTGCQTTTTSPTSLTVTTDVTIPGIPTELYYISQSVGFVVTATVSKERHPTETETLYWFGMSGEFRGIHPFLGPGLHGIIAVPLQTSKVNTQRLPASNCVTEERPQRWHLYFADGFGGICCIRL